MITKINFDGVQMNLTEFADSIGGEGVKRELMFFIEAGKDMKEMKRALFQVSNGSINMYSDEIIEGRIVPAVESYHEGEFPFTVHSC